MRSIKEFSGFVAKGAGARGNLLFSVLFLTAVILLGMTVFGPERAAGKNKVEEIPFGAAQIRIEVNSTDGDAGLQIFLDGEAWKKIRIEDPNGKPRLCRRQLRQAEEAREHGALHGEQRARFPGGHVPPRDTEAPARGGVRLRGHYSRG